MIKFKLNKEEELFIKLVKIGEDLKVACGSLRQLFVGVLNNEEDTVNSNIVKIKTVTERIAMSREETLSIIYGGAFLPDFKEAMVMLTQALYQTSAAIKDAARAVSSRKPAEKCLINLRESILSYLSTIDEASVRLEDMLSKLSNDINEALKVGKEIQMLERSGDELKDMLISRLYSMEKDIDLITILQMRDVIFFLDDILDFMEDATLSIEVLYATLKS